MTSATLVRARERRRLLIKQRKQTADCWQLLVFRSFYGSSEPGMPLYAEYNPVESSTPPLSLYLMIHPAPRFRSARPASRSGGLAEQRIARADSREISRRTAKLGPVVAAETDYPPAARIRAESQGAAADLDAVRSRRVAPGSICRKALRRRSSRIGAPSRWRRALRR